MKRMKWQDDPGAAAIMSLMLRIGEEQGVSVLPIFVTSDDPATTILDLAATMAIDFLMLGATHRLTMSRILKGSVVEAVSSGLPEDIQLITKTPTASRYRQSYVPSKSDDEFGRL